MLVNRVHKPYACRICGNAVGIKVCKCQKAYYCSKNCQKIDWKMHKSDCYQMVEHPKTSGKQMTTAMTSNVQSQPSQQQQSLVTNAQSQEPSVQARRQYDPTPLQYMQQAPDSTTTSAPQSSIEDFEENLFNSLMYSVDESTEREILENLNISDEILATYSLVADNASFEDQSISQPDIAEDQAFGERIFEQIQRRQSYEQKPEYKEARDDLEKELLHFREINLHEPQQQLDDSDSSSNASGSMMQLTSNNPKYINHAKLDDHILYK